MIVFAKFIMLILCAFIQFHIYPINALNVTAILMAMIISCLPVIIKNDFFQGRGLKFISNILWGIFVLASVFVNELTCYLPLVFMDILSYKLLVPVMIVPFSLAIKGFSELDILLIILSAISCLAQFAMIKVNQLSHELKLLRDTSKERELLIEEKNRKLIEKQDTDIYAATLKERNRIAREIHDNVGHMLTRSILQVGAIKTINQNDVLKEPLEGLHETLNTAMTNIRNSVHDLHDESVDLQSAILEITEGVENIKMNLQYDMSRNVPKNVKYCFITITKEAVNNTIKHSNATHMDIIMQEHPAFYQLLIHDNGSNINVNVPDGIGLTNMRDRVKALNGNIKISTDNGFKILISIIKTGV